MRCFLPFLALFFFLFQSIFLAQDRFVPPFLIDNLMTDKKVVALTFDDGPHAKNTEKILEILKENQVRASFFLVGVHTLKYPALARKIYQHGHDIGNHSYAHLSYTTLNQDEVLMDLALSQKVFKDTLGTFPSLFRAPYGRLRKSDEEILRRFFRHGVAWSIDPKDWESNASQITAHILSRVAPGKIILCHEYNRAIIKALPDIIEGIREKGYDFVTISQIVEEWNAASFAYQNDQDSTVR